MPSLFPCSPVIHVCERKPRLKRKKKEKIGKRLKYCLRPKHKKSNFQSKDKLKTYVRIWVSLLKIRGISRK